MQPYRIADEPLPSGIAKVAVHPFWPLFAVMFCGPWLAWPWAIVNAIALGSPTVKKEIAIAIGGLLGSFFIFFAMTLAFKEGWLPSARLPYALLILTVWKLGVSYWLYETQGRTFSLYEYYGGETSNGFFVILIANFFLEPKVIAPLLQGHAILQKVLL